MARLPRCGPDVGHNHGGRLANLHARMPWKQLQQEELLLFIEGFVALGHILNGVIYIVVMISMIMINDLQIMTYC